MRSRDLVCYDITDERRLTHVFRPLKGAGVHLPYSVFLCSLTWPELEQLTRDMADRLHSREDDVRFYPLPAGEAYPSLGYEDCVPDGATAVLP